MPVRVEHLGKKCRCERCGHIFLVVASPTSQTTRDAAGKPEDEYEPWGVDDAPLPSELLTRQPKLLPVHCRLCFTLMYATEKQVGGSLACPDCGVKTVVKRPPPELPPRPEPLVEGYELGEATAPGPRPTAVPMVVRNQLAKQQAERHEQEENRPVEYTGTRPKLPRVPLVQGVLSMLLCEAILVRWIILSISLTIVIWLLSFALLPVYSQYQVVALAGLVFGVLWAMSIAAIWIAVLIESSDGNDRLHNPPDMLFYDWFGNLIYVAVASAIAGVPFGVIAVPLVEWLRGDLGAWLPGGAATGGWLFCFPIVLLSMLEQGSPLAILSPRIVGSLVRQPMAWLLFYAETALLVAGSAMAVFAAVKLSPWLMLAVGPTAVALSLLYFRLLGRLAWWLAEEVRK